MNSSAAALTAAIIAANGDQNMINQIVIGILSAPSSNAPIASTSSAPVLSRVPISAPSTVSVTSGYDFILTENMNGKKDSKSSSIVGSSYDSPQMRAIYKEMKESLKITFKVMSKSSYVQFPRTAFNDVCNYLANKGLKLNIIREGQSSQKEAAKNNAWLTFVNDVIANFDTYKSDHPELARAIDEKGKIDRSVVMHICGAEGLNLYSRYGKRDEAIIARSSFMKASSSNASSEKSHATATQISATKIKDVGCLNLSDGIDMILATYNDGQSRKASIIGTSKNGRTVDSFDQISELGSDVVKTIRKKTSIGIMTSEMYDLFKNTPYYNELKRFIYEEIEEDEEIEEIEEQ